MQTTSLALVDNPHWRERLVVPVRVVAREASVAVAVADIPLVVAAAGIAEEEGPRRCLQAIFLAAAVAADRSTVASSTMTTMLLFPASIPAMGLS